LITEICGTYEGYAAPTTISDEDVRGRQRGVGIEATCKCGSSRLIGMVRTLYVHGSHIAGQGSKLLRFMSYTAVPLCDCQTPGFWLSLLLNHINVWSAS